MTLDMLKSDTHVNYFTFYILNHYLEEVCPDHVLAPWFVENIVIEDRGGGIVAAIAIHRITICCFCWD